MINHADPMNLNEYNLKFNNNFETDILINISKILKNKSFLLINPSIEYNMLEQFIYNIAKYHTYNEDNTDLNCNFENKSIEFKFINNNELYNENKSILDQEFNNSINSESLNIITYLTNSNKITIVSEMNIDEYKYKKYLNTNFALSSHKKYKQLVFNNAKHIHCYSNISTLNETYEDIMLIIKIWDTKPNNISYFNNSIFQKKYCTQYNEDILKHNYDIIETMENVNNIITLEDDFSKILENIFYNEDQSIYKELLINYLKNSLIYKHNDYDYDIIYFKNIKKLVYPCLTINKVLDINTCEWINNEFNEYTNNNDDWLTIGNKLDIDNIPIITRLLLRIFNNKISTHITDSYYKDYNCEMNIDNIFIIKCDSSNYKNIIDNDNSNVKVFIPLNTKDTGDMILYKNNEDFIIDNTDICYAILFIIDVKLNYKKTDLLF